MCVCVCACVCVCVCVCHSCVQILPTMDKVIAEMTRLSVEFADVPMLSRTHGQTASPTTMGKELAVFAYRLQRQRDLVRGLAHTHTRARTHTHTRTPAQLAVSQHRSQEDT